MTSHPLNAEGDFYVEHGCCTACDVPMQSALALFAYDETSHHPSFTPPPPPSPHRPPWQNHPLRPAGNSAVRSVVNYQARSLEEFIGGPKAAFECSRGDAPGYGDYGLWPIGVPVTCELSANGNGSKSHAQAARDLIQTHLPADLVSALDLDSLELQKDTFVDEELRESYSDLLYSVQLADQDGQRGQGQVYLLLEHKSQSDPMTCFELLRYIVRIWEQRLRNGQSLCPVFPLVVYHGQEAWSAPVSLEESIGGPSRLFEYGVRLAYPVLDIGRIPDESLAREPFLQSILGLLKYGRSRDFKDKLEFLLRCLLEGGAGDLHLGHLKAVVVYISAVSPSIPLEVLEMKIEKMFPMRYEPGSIADQYIKKGRLEGEIHLIQTLQEILGLPVSDGATLEDQSLEDLQAITGELRQQFRDRK